MSLLISLSNASLTNAGVAILDNVNWQISRQQHFALIGRNGAGKSTLLRALNKELSLDKGALHLQKGLSIACLPQDLSLSYGKTVFEDIFKRVQAQGALQGADCQYFQVTADRVELNPAYFDEPSLTAFVKELNELLQVMQLGAQDLWESLSGGMKRRCALVAALLVRPEVLLLDEPTNHLDIAAIVWLEQFIKNFAGAVVFVTHDRIFLQNVATHIVALEDGLLRQYNYGYDAYLQQRATEAIEAENETNRMKQRLLQEEHWLQRGVTARRKRNQGRLQALMTLRKNIAERQKELGLPGQWNPQVIRSGRVIMTAENISYAVAQKAIVKDFSFLMMRGDKIGIVGPNGCGKTTLAKILLGQLQPNAGRIKFTNSIEPIYVDQLQSQLNLQESLFNNVADGAEYIALGEEKVHVAGYLKDFLFAPEQLQRSISTLSGGEKQRLLLAKCLALPGNFMVLDEPSNDLDLESLELLANLLVQYSGTFILISHDRALIEDCVTRLLVWEEPGVFREILPSQWQINKPLTVQVNKVPETTKHTAPSRSYAEQKELLKLPDEIAKIEAQISKLHHEMGDAGFYLQNAQTIAAVQSNLNALEEKLMQYYARWEELEQKN